MTAAELFDFDIDYLDISPDTGCAIAGASKCVSCPLPQCVEDRPSPDEIRQRRNAEILAMYESKIPIATIAAEYNISERSIHRVVSKKTHSKK